MDTTCRHTIICLAALLLAGCGGETRQPVVVVFAAASLRDAVSEIGLRFEIDSGIRVLTNFAGSNVLAQQIVATSKADVYLSASERWMELIDDRERVVDGTRQPFAGNRLVVIVNRSGGPSLDSPAALADRSIRHLALGDPDAVPAGRYARAWLESVDHGDRSLWDTVQDRIAPSPDVRAALGLVESDRRIVGIVYATDAAASDRVRVAYRVPDDESPAIRYWRCRVSGGRNPEGADRFLAFLESPAARAILETHGFTGP